MNPDTNIMEEIKQFGASEELLGIKDGEVDIRPGAMARNQLVRPNGKPVPEYWSSYAVDEVVTVKNYKWRVAHMGEKHLLLEPVGPILIGCGGCGSTPCTCGSTAQSP